MLMMPELVVYGDATGFHGMGVPLNVEVWSNKYPVESAAGHDTITLFPERATARRGAPGVCSAKTLQNPPSNE